MNRLIIGVIFLFSTFSCFGQDDEEEYPSREQIRYYKKARYKEFKPESISVIRQIRYDYVNIRTLDMPRSM